MQANRLYQWVVFPVIVVAVAVGVTVYLVNNPGDEISRQMLSYEKITRFFIQHLKVVVVSSTLAVGAAVPVGILITRPRFRRFARPVINLANVGQTVPSIAVLALAMSFLGLGFKTAVFALWLYSLLPILHNTCAGLEGVDRGILEAARGMGMSPRRILMRVEIPLALPVITAGIRTALTINIGTATLAAFIGAGGLGDLIVTGIQLSRMKVLVAGALLTALLAIFVDHLVGLIQETYFSGA